MNEFLMTFKQTWCRTHTHSHTHFFKHVSRLKWWASKCQRLSLLSCPPLRGSVSGYSAWKEQLARLVAIASTSDTPRVKALPFSAPAAQVTKAAEFNMCQFNRVWWDQMRRVSCVSDRGSSQSIKALFWGVKDVFMARAWLAGVTTRRQSALVLDPDWSS